MVLVIFRRFVVQMTWFPENVLVLCLYLWFGYIPETAGLHYCVSPDGPKGNEWVNKRQMLSSGRCLLLQYCSKQ